MSQTFQLLIAIVFIVLMALAGFGLAHYLGQRPRRRKMRRPSGLVGQSTRNSPSSTPMGLATGALIHPNVTAPLRTVGSGSDNILAHASQQAVDSAITGLDAPNPHMPGSAEAALWANRYEKVYTEWAGQKKRTPSR